MNESIQAMELDGVREVTVYDSADSAQLIWEYRVPYFMLCRETHPDGSFELTLDKPWDEEHRQNVRGLLDGIQDYLLQILRAFLQNRSA